MNRGHTSNSASLYFWYGVMNSSKSARLLMTNHNYLEQGKDTIIFKPVVDTRDGCVVKSRALGDAYPAVMVESHDYGLMYDKVEKERPTAVLVDEVQFMSVNQVNELASIVDELHVPVICVGLMTDFRSEMFSASKRLVELGAKLEEVKTICTYCNRKAGFNMRLNGDVPVFDGEQVLIGGNEQYKPVCRSCFMEAKALSDLERVRGRVL